MATTFTTAADADMTTDAEFRTTATFIHDVFSNAGWVQTSDTGQINLTTVAKPAGTNTAAGYEIWRMADTLQGTAPIYIKMEYGTGVNNQRFAYWFTIGTGSDGAGTITGTRKARTGAIGSAAANNAPLDSFGSGDTNRVCFAMFANSTSAIWFSLERMKDANGDDVDDGLILAYGVATTGHVSQVIPYTGSVPTAETGLQYILSSVNPSTFGADTGIGVMIPMLGVAQQPGMNVAVCLSSDFGAGASISMTIYGASHTYQRMDNITTLKGNSGGTLAGTGDRLLLRYE
jgi:hypothetical protein